MDFVPQPSPTVQRQVPQAGLPLPVASHLLRGLSEAVAEAQVVADGVFPAVRRGYEEREVLPADRMSTRFRVEHWHKE